MAQSLTDLPANVLTEILVRLPLRTIFVTRSVCKTFLSLTTPNPHFAALHASNAAPTLAFQFGDPCFSSYVLRLAEPELDIASPQNSELKPLFQLPKLGRGPNLFGTDLREGNSLFLANSCNGLVFFFSRLVGDERSLVCNPVTNEYVMIPEGDLENRLFLRKTLWLGFCPGTHRYKLLRMFCPMGNDSAAQVLVIGSDSWREIDDTPSRSILSWDMCSTFVNGFIYWLDKLWTKILSFDFEREKFGDVALPTEFQEEQFRNKHCTSIGVLGGCLCLCGNDFAAQCVGLWVMRKCGNKDCWRKEFVVHMVRPTGKPVPGLLKPLQFLRNGEIVMLWTHKGLVCYDPRTGILRFFGLDGLRLAHKAVAFTPSFVPLKETLKVEKVLSPYARPGCEEWDPFEEEEKQVINLTVGS